MSRAAQILNALESTRATSADEFAALLGVSRRTVAGEVASLQELLGQAASITLVEGRYRLLVADPPRYRAVRSGLASSTSFNDPAARASFIVARLFRATQPVRIEELAQEMSVGRTTVVADLNRVREHVGEWELEIEGRTHVGLVLRGPELQQRLLILRHHYPTAYDHHPSWQQIEQAVAGLGVFGQPFVGGGHAVMGAGDVINSDANNLTIVPVGFPIDEAPQTDLWPLQVCKDAHGATGLVGCFTNPFVVLLMIFMVAMREVHPGDVHAGFHKTEDSLFACDGWTQRTHNFCSSIHASHPNHLWPHKPHRNAR